MRNKLGDPRGYGMEIKDFLEAKKEMEKEILEAVHKAMGKFQDATGFTPSRINIDTVECTRFGSPRKEFEVVSISACVDLE